MRLLLLLLVPLASPFQSVSLRSHRRPPSLLHSTLKPILTKLIDREDLSTSEAQAAFTSILSDADPIQVGSLLTLLRAKGEKPAEITGMIRAMLSACNAVKYDGKMLDIVGTGGDGADTINISTASVVLAAACGCIVAKAGNRSVSSACGSADVLERLGVKVDLKPAEVVKCVDQCGIAFMFAPVNHPAMKAVAPVRAALGVRTVFNILGPMTNAAGAQRAVIGVFDEGLQDLMAESLVNVGRIDHAVVIHGCGLDEISPLGPSKIVEIKRGEGGEYSTKKYEFDPATVGVARCMVEDLKGGDPEMNKNEFLRVLQPLSASDPNTAKRDAVVLNAGFGNYVYGLTDSVEAGIALARSTLDSGKAITVLEKWIDVSNKV